MQRELIGRWGKAQCALLDVDTTLSEIIENVRGKTDGKKRTFLLSPLRAFTHKKISSFLSNLLSKSFDEWHFKFFFVISNYYSGLKRRKIWRGKRMKSGETGSSNRKHPKSQRCLSSRSPNLRGGRRDDPTSIDVIALQVILKFADTRYVPKICFDFIQLEKRRIDPDAVD
jgi:hypothetical protein